MRAKVKDERVRGTHAMILIVELLAPRCHPPAPLRCGTPRRTACGLPVVLLRLAHASTVSPVQVRYIQYLVCERLGGGDGLPVRGSKVRKENAEGGEAKATLAV